MSAKLNDLPQDREALEAIAWPRFAQPDPGLSVCLTVSASHPAWVCRPAAQEVVDRFDFSALAPVRPTTGPCRTLRCSRMSGCPLPLLRRWLYSVRRHRPERLSDTPCRTVHGNESWAIPSLLHATPSATSEH